MPGKFQDQDKTVFVSNIEQRVTEELLWELFLQVNLLITFKYNFIYFIQILVTFSL